MPKENRLNWEKLLIALDEAKKGTEPPEDPYQYFEDGYLNDLPTEAYAKLAFITVVLDNISSVEILKKLDRQQMIEIEGIMYDGTTDPDIVVDRLGKLGLEAIENGNMERLRNLALLTGYVMEYGVGKLFSPTRLIPERAYEGEGFLEAAILATEFTNPDFVLINHDNENDKITLEEFQHALLSSVCVIPWAEERLAPRDKRKEIFPLVYSMGTLVVLRALQQVQQDTWTGTILAYANERYKEGTTVKDAFSESRLLSVALRAYVDLNEEG